MYELVYTSVPQGLRPGTSGFCAVAMSREMHPMLIQHLERLSSYRHVNPAGSSNPIAKSFSCATIQGKLYYILSRVSDAGLDYSGRSNHIAHHIAIESATELPAGPAWYLERNELFYDKWNGQPRYLPQRELPATLVEPAPCLRWKNVTGDAGWATAPIENGLKGKTSTLIVRPNVDTISLFGETIALLPASSRWRSTFTTYYTKSAGEAEFQWRMVQQDSPEGRVRDTSLNAVIDLTSKLGPAQGKFADDARFGRFLNQEAGQPKVKVSDHAMPFVTSKAEFSDSSSSSNSSISNAGRPVPPAPVEPPIVPESAPPLPWAGGMYPHKKQVPWWAFAAVLLVGMALGGVMVWLVLKPERFALSGDSSAGITQDLNAEMSDSPEILNKTEPLSQTPINENQNSRTKNEGSSQPSEKVPPIPPVPADISQPDSPESESPTPSDADERALAEARKNLRDAIIELNKPENSSRLIWDPGKEGPVWTPKGVSSAALSELSVNVSSPLAPEYKFKCELLPPDPDPPSYWQISCYEDEGKLAGGESGRIGKILFWKPDEIKWDLNRTKNASDWVNANEWERAFLYSQMTFSMRTDPGSSFTVQFKEPEQTTLAEMIDPGFVWDLGFGPVNELAERIKFAGKRSVIDAEDLTQELVIFSAAPPQRIFGDTPTPDELLEQRINAERHKLKQEIMKMLAKIYVRYELDTANPDHDSDSVSKGLLNKESKTDAKKEIRIKLNPTLRLWFARSPPDNGIRLDDFQKLQDIEPDFEMELTASSGHRVIFTKENDLINEINKQKLVKTLGIQIEEKFRGQKSLTGITRSVSGELCNDILEQINKQHAEMDFNLYVSDNDSVVPVIQVNVETIASPAIGDSTSKFK